MEEKDKKIYDLETQVESLNLEIVRLQGLLEQAGIDYTKDMERGEDQTDSIKNICISNGTKEQVIIMEKITPQHASYFYTFFKGRNDVYSRRSKLKNGGFGYFPACNNLWKYGICPKKEGKKIRCQDCANRSWKQLTQTLIMEHLIGAKEDCSDVIGLYPLLLDETCNFLVFDFDNHDIKEQTDATEGANMNHEWIEEVNAMRDICKIHEVDVLVERSRSGKGAHIWILFEEPVPAVAARKFGTALLTIGAESVNQKSFKSYDRMLPAQDHMPEGGLGNLIALPLQGQALKNGNSAFIDENWNAYENQWQILRKVKKLSKVFIEEKIAEWSANGILGMLSEDMSGEEPNQSNKEKKTPWKKQTVQFEKEDVEGKMQLILANQIYIESDNIKSRLQNRIRRLAAYSNPEYYKNQAMGYSTNGISRIVSCGYDIDDYICIPRGCLEKLIEKLNDAKIDYVITDERQCGREIAVRFQGGLYPEQQKAVDKMLQFDCGILGAATAFGKTAVGAYLIAEKKVNTLILVHNKEIMKNWCEDFEKFLIISEELPEYKTASGRVKKRKSVIGKLYAGHNSLTGILDVVMITSLGKAKDINPIVKDYGLVIMDECHHAGAQTAEEVLREIKAKYVYGLTATPKRDDGQEKKMFMQLGPVRHRFTARDKAKLQGIEHFVYPRFTRLINTTGRDLNINEAYKAVISNEFRNQQIVSDVEECLKNGRTPLVLTKFKEHAEILMRMLENKVQHTLLLQGGRSNKERDRIRGEMRNIPKDEAVVLVAIAQYIGEGFNYPRLDTMMLATPIAWQGNVEQYAGRLHRDYEGKREVIIYDYVDFHIRILEKMYHKRLRAYKKIGYELCMNIINKKQEANAIFDCETYVSVYERDLQEANEEIIISSPGINNEKVKRIKRLIQKKQELGIRVTVMTLCAENYPENRIGKTKELISMLSEAGMIVKTFPVMHEHFAIVDHEIVWYGSMNLLSREKEEDNLMRVQSKEIAQELLERVF